MTTLKQFAIELPALRDEAKALWGKTLVESKYPMYVHSRPAYVHHLMQMLISDDPVKYLKDNS